MHFISTSMSVHERQQRFTRSKARLGCALTTPASNAIESEFVFWEIDSVPYFELQSSRRILINHSFSILPNKGNL